MMDIARTCAFSGHRPQKLPWQYDETAAGCVALKAVLAERIAQLARAGMVHFLSGMAQGTDIWCAEAVLLLREQNPAVKLHCILPCTTQADKWSAAARRRYDAILDQADSIVRVSRAYHPGCMLERDRFLVDWSSTLLAVYNGEYRGGTAATVRYAQKLGRRVLLIHPETLQCVEG